MAVAVDEGQHVIQASAPKHQTWQTTAETYGQGKTLSVEIPPLAAAPEGPPAAGTAESVAPGGAASTDDGATGWGTQRTLAIVAGAIGVVGLGVGTYFGLQSFSKHSDYQNHCAGSVCDPTGVQLHDDAVSAGNISTIAMAIGGVALATGLTLWLTAPPMSPSTPRTGASLVVGPGVLGARGVW
jgi:hypothetical protein